MTNEALGHVRRRAALGAYRRWHRNEQHRGCSEQLFEHRLDSPNFGPERFEKTREFGLSQPEGSIGLCVGVQLS
jgi:hypothetical protein